MTYRMAAAAALLAAAAAVFLGAGSAYAAVIAVASAVAMTDAREQLVPNCLSAFAAVAAVGVWVNVGAPLIAVAVAAAALLGLYVAWLGEWCGGGDVKFIPALVLVAAALGDPLTAVLRVLIFGAVLVLIASLWPRPDGASEGPLLVGGPFALQLTVVL